MARTLTTLSVAVAGALIAAGPASAADPVTCDGLQDALNAAPAGSTVTLKQGEHCTDSYFLPPRKITLQGEGTEATRPVLDGGGEIRILTGSNVGATVIRNLTFKGGSDGDLDDSDGGGAILVDSNSPITVEKSSFEDNSTDGPGGAIAIHGSPPPVGDQVLGRGLSELPHVVIRESRFGAAEDGGNSSNDQGGAVAIDTPFPVDVIKSTFTGNTAGSGGGGLSVFSGDTVTLTGNTFTGNTSRGDGGGAELTSCDNLSVSDNVFAQNAAESGQTEGGSQVRGGGLWVDGCNFSERSAALGKGDFGTLQQSGNTFRQNLLEGSPQSTAEGAGEWVNRVTLNSTDDTYHANKVAAGAIGHGAGLRYEDGDGAVLRNFVATANTMSFGDGGGVSFDAFGATLEVVHATIAANAIGEGQGSGVFGGRGQSLSMDNSIVHGNTGGTEIAGFTPFETVSRAAGLGAQVTGIDLAYTLACNGSAAFPGTGNLCADPKLAGAGTGNVHQTAASPTLEKASAERTAGLTTDYEGDARVIDYDRANGAQPDMGADEAPAPPLAEEQPAPAAPAAQPSGGVLGTQARSCASKRSFKIKLRNRGQKVVKATVIVNGKRVKVLRGKRLTSHVNLRGLPKGRFTVKIKLKLANGKVITGTRRYRTCTPGRPSGPPKV